MKVQNFDKERKCSTCKKKVGVDKECHFYPGGTATEEHKGKKAKKQHNFLGSWLCLACFKKVFKKVPSGPEDYNFEPVRQMDERLKLEREAAEALVAAKKEKKK